MKLIVVLTMFLGAFTPSNASAAPGPLPAARDWLNGTPTTATLAGRVVIVDVFTFDCINCKHVVPELRALYTKFSRHDLAIVGIHSPETPQEKIRANVVASLRDQGISWPVALDNSFVLWRAYGIEYWPTQMIFDRRGTLRKTIVGEGQDALLESTVALLLAAK